MFRMTFVKKKNAGLLKSVRSWGVLGLILALAVVFGYGPQDVSLGQEPRQAQPPNPFKVGQKFTFTATYLAQTGSPPRMATVDSDSGNATYEVTTVTEDTVTFRVANVFSQLVAGRMAPVPTEPVDYVVNTLGKILQTNINVDDPTARGIKLQDVQALNIVFELFAFNLQAGQKLRIGIDEYTVGKEPVEITIAGVKYRAWEAARLISSKDLSGNVKFHFNAATGMLIQHTGQIEFLTDIAKKELGADRISVTVQRQEEGPPRFDGMALDTLSTSAACVKQGGIWAGAHIPSGTSERTYKCFARHLNLTWSQIIAVATCVVSCAVTQTGGAAIFACIKTCVLPSLLAIQTASQHCKWPSKLYP